MHERRSMMLSSIYQHLKHISTAKRNQPYTKRESKYVPSGRDSVTKHIKFARASILCRRRPYLFTAIYIYVAAFSKGTEKIELCPICKTMQALTSSSTIQCDPRRNCFSSTFFPNKIQPYSFSPSSLVRVECGVRVVFLEHGALGMFASHPFAP